MTGPRVSRRQLFTGGAAALVGGVAGAGIVAATSGTGQLSSRPVSVGKAVEPFYGARQSGIATPPQAHAAFVAFTLADGTDREALVRMLRLLTDDAARLTQGAPALADTEPELAADPARLTVTFGFGPRFFDIAGVPERRPSSVADLPPFPTIDQLDPTWSGGDLLLQICADDPVTVSHAQRMLVKDARPFGTVRWVQRGFRNSPGVHEPTQTQRNLMGQLDGTSNPVPGTVDFEAAVWVNDGPQWLRDSTTLVIRRIRIELETWDQLGRFDKEMVVGRRLDTGAPLTGTNERDEPDFDAVDEHGLPVIDLAAHVRRSHVADPRLRMFRRQYNYDGSPDAAGRPDSGLIFAAYQADIDRQFLPVQQRIAEQDLLNEWTTPIGSAVFAIPPGCQEGGWIGEQLLS